MFFKTSLLALGVMVTSAASALAATQYNFSYTYSDSTVLSGSLEGVLQADNDTIFVSGFADVFVGATQLSSIEASDIRSSSDFPTGALQPFVSLSGSTIDIFVCSMGFSASGNCSLGTEGGFFLDNIDGGIEAAGGDGLGFSVFDSTFVAQNWSISPVTQAVPLPAAGVLFLTALGGLAAARRRKAKAA